MTKMHFVEAARLVKISPLPEDTRRIIARAYAELFRQYNPRFDVDRFYTACGLSAD